MKDRWADITIALLFLTLLGAVIYRDCPESFAPGPEQIPTIITWIFGGLAILFATLAFVLIKEPFHTALLFGLSILGVAGLTLTQAAPFIAFSLLIVYGGAIVVMFLFVIMLSPKASPEIGSGLYKLAIALLPLGIATYMTQPWEPRQPYTNPNQEYLQSVAGELNRIEADADLKTIASIVSELQEELTDKLAAETAKVSYTNRSSWIVLHSRLRAIADGITDMNMGQEEALVQVQECREFVYQEIGKTKLPARNVVNLGVELSRHGDAIILAGVLLFVATIGSTMILYRNKAVRVK